MSVSEMIVRLQELKEKGLGDAQILIADGALLHDTTETGMEIDGYLIDTVYESLQACSDDLGNPIHDGYLNDKGEVTAPSDYIILTQTD